MKRFQTTLVVALCVALASGPAVATEAQASTTSDKTTQAKDLRLSRGGLLRGVALTTQMKPIANADVLVHFQGHVIARTKSADDGSFAVQGLRGGIHTVSIGARSDNVRFWTAQAAPPKAKTVLAINGEEQVMRGQYVPPVSLPVVITALGAGLIGGILGYNLRDCGGKKGGGSDDDPESP